MAFFLRRRRAPERLWPTAPRFADQRPLKATGGYHSGGAGLKNVKSPFVPTAVHSRLPTHGVIGTIEIRLRERLAQIFTKISPACLKV